MIDSVTTLLSVPALACYGSGAVATWENPNKTCHVYLSTIDYSPVFMFKGTEDAQEWQQDFNPFIEPDADDPDIGSVHAPSLLNVKAVMPAIIAHMTALNWVPFYLCGHSKGAREAPIAHALLKHIGHPPLATRLYEPPRPGGIKLADYLATENIIGTQTYNESGVDIVTVVPAGFGWEPACHIIRLQVPNTYGIKAKHVMTGVIAGLS
jgi:hypothetical protein